MKKFVIVVAVLSICFCTCKKQAEKGTAEKSAETVKTTISIVQVPTSEKYRKAFNETAQALYGFLWVKDEQNMNKIDAEAGELYVPQALRAKFGLPPDVIKMTPQLAAAIITVENEVQSVRRNAVKNTLSKQKEAHLWFDLASLSEPNQKAARYLIEAAYWLHELYKLQVDKNVPVTEQQVHAFADPDSIHLFERNAGAICGRYGDKEKCSILPFYDAEPTSGAIMWPDSAGKEMFEGIKSKVADPVSDSLLSPFTAVKKISDGNYQAVPFAQFEPFKSYLEKIAALLEQASDIQGIDITFATQLKLQAAAFKSAEARPFFTSDDAWGKAKGELELIIGPYESYSDMFGTKAFYEFALGAEDKAATELIQKFVPLLPHIEQMFSLTVGPDTYHARTIDSIPPLRVVDVIMGSGEMRKAGGPSIALSLPNIGPMADEGRAKRVIFANHHKAKYQILRPIADIALVPEQLVDVDPQSFVYDSTFHELMHGIGPQRETKVGLSHAEAVSAVQAGETTVALALGEYYDGLEEAKANVGGIWAAKYLADAGVLTSDELRKIQTTYVAGLLRIMRFGAKEAHAMGAALEFSYLYSKGAIEERGEKFFINYEKLQDALNSIVSEIGVALAKGDKAAAKALIEGYPAKAPALLETMAKKIDAAGIPRDVALVYHIKGI